MSRRTDNRIRLVTIPDGLPVHITAQLLMTTSAVVETANERAIKFLSAATPTSHTTAAQRAFNHRERITPIVEIRSDGIAVFAHRSIVTGKL